MGKQQNSEFYDRLFERSAKYNAHYASTPYYRVWRHIIRMLNAHNARVLDLGCGPGQFAHFCRDENVEYECGIDFSLGAVKAARTVNPDLQFVQEDLAASDAFLDTYYYNTVTCLEVLEHVIEDRKILKRIPPGMRVIFSVPNFDSESHVRTFSGAPAIRERYSDLLDIVSFARFKMNKTNTIFVVDSEKL